MEDPNIDVPAVQWPRKFQSKLGKVEEEVNEITALLAAKSAILAMIGTYKDQAENGTARAKSMQYAEQIAIAGTYKTRRELDRAKGAHDEATECFNEATTRHDEANRVLQEATKARHEADSELAKLYEDSEERLVHDRGKKNSMSFEVGTQDLNVDRATYGARGKRTREDEDGDFDPAVGRVRKPAKKGAGRVVHLGMNQKKAKQT
ncbi:hypothetical protein LTR62_002168 [Meristemomyces frigidus]|uniref:Uncharacterized protein n=1 Tax=Meristemomyces frigidus TaxID=1508187 RepID=A0AAN7YFW2_9PEZI|nr:hypothetical protein LTR62_002168 [Meristemomyces frigidus]